MEKRFRNTERSSYPNVLKFFVLIFIGQQVSGQSEPDLGIFAVSFEIVLSNGQTDDSVTTVAVTTAALTTVAETTMTSMTTTSGQMDDSVTTATETTTTLTTVAETTSTSMTTTQPASSATTDETIAVTSWAPDTSVESTAVPSSAPVETTAIPSSAPETPVETTSVPSSATSTSSEITSPEPAPLAALVLDESTPSSQPENVTSEISSELHVMLSGVFATTTAYQYTTKPIITGDTGTVLTYRYDVVYDKTQLNAASLLQKDSDFIEELRNVSDVIITWPENFTESFSVDDAQTRTAMTTTIDTLNEQFAQESWLCTGSTCADNTTTCWLNETSGSLVCVDKCQVFAEENQCTDEPSVFGVYLKGSCILDSHGNPYCDCGMSPGDVMSNFYDGEQCVSVTFIVAMAASAGGFLFILWLITLCILCKRGRSRGGKHSRRSSSSDGTANYPGYHGAYHNNREPSHKTYHNEYASHAGPVSSHSNNAYEVTVDSDEEFKSARL